MWESVDTIVSIGVRSTSISLSITGIGLIFLPKSAGNACVLSLGNKVSQELIIIRYNKYKNQVQKDQQTNKSFGKIYCKT